MTKINWQMVDRYFADEATSAERIIVERWLAESPAFRMLVSELYRTALDDATVDRAEAEVGARLDQDASDVAAPTPRPAPPHRRQPAPRRIGVPALAAAAAVILVVGSVIVVRESRHFARAGSHDVAMRSTTAPARQRTPVSLSDGSQVILSPGSTLFYPATFRPGMPRDVRLDGEAYFDVDHDARRPFIVRAGDLVAEDLGTQFVVRAYREDAHARVIVRQGRVGIAGQVVAPGQLGRLSATGEPVVEPADTASWFAWTRGRLVFEGMTLRDALPKLSRWYDRDFRLADSTLGDLVLVATLPANLTDDGLDAIAIAFGLRQEQRGRVVTFYPPRGS